MRLSTLALLIALPTAAYAAVCAEQLSVGHDMVCSNWDRRCDFADPWCPLFDCLETCHDYGVCFQRISPAYR
jgi:hypothetical protein